jgi:hypothetical protein
MFVGWNRTTMLITRSSVVGVSTTLSGILPGG